MLLKSKLVLEKHFIYKFTPSYKVLDPKAKHQIVFEKFKITSNSEEIEDSAV